LAFRLQAQRGEDVPQFDESVVLARVFGSELTLIGLLSEGIQTRLCAWVEFQRTESAHAIGIEQRAADSSRLSSTPSTPELGFMTKGYHKIKLRVENAFAPELVAVHPVEEQDGGFAGRKDVLHFGGVPPKASFRHRFVHRQRSVKEAWDL
jgi:hypothetical protein